MGRVCGNNCDMSRKQYIQKATSTILNRVKFHAPIVFDDDVNFKALQSGGVDARMPIFIFDKQLSRPLLRAFVLARKQENFNLLFSNRSVGKLQKAVCKKLPGAVIFDENCSSAFLQAISKLNINYFSSSNYNLSFKENFFKVNGQILNPHFEDFSLRQVAAIGRIFVDYQEFVLNGNNFFCQMQNSSSEQAKVEVELNIPLAKGYYYFKRLSRAVMIENLLTKEKMYLNFVCRNAKFSFSDVDGLENSVFSCVNVKAIIQLAAGEESHVFFNFGISKFAPRGLDEIKKMKALSWRKCCEIFNLQVKTKNPQFDFFFNKTLPQRIWINWLNGQVDDALEAKYVALKRLFVKGSLGTHLSRKMTPRACMKDTLQRTKSAEVPENGLTLVNFPKIGLREIGVFNGKYYKKIFVVAGGEKFLKVGRTCFYNICGITEHSLGSQEPISVCFGQ